MHQLPESIRNLSLAEKYELLDAIWENIEASSDTLTSEQEQELERRMAEYATNPETALSWETLRAKLSDGQ